MPVLSVFQVIESLQLLSSVVEWDNQFRYDPDSEVYLA